MKQKQKGALPKSVSNLKSKYQQHGDVVIQILKDNETGVYEHQRDAVLSAQKLIEAQREAGNDDPVLIVAPTGSGKSGMIVLLPYALKSNKVLIITPSKVIGEQLGDAFCILKYDKCFFNVANLTDDEETARKYLEQPTIVRNTEDLVRFDPPNLAIVNAQKLGGRSGLSLNLRYGNQDVIKNLRKTLSKYDTLIIDEAHHYPAETWKKIVDEFKGMNKNIIFLTATPYRYVNGKQFNILPKQQVAFTVTPEMVQGTTTRVSEFLEQEHNDREGKHLMVDICTVLDHQEEHWPLDSFPQAVVLVNTKADARRVAAKLNRDVEDDTFAVPIYCGQESSITDFNKQNHVVAVTCGLLVEGYDNTNVSLCVILRNVQSQILFNQFIGRCTRKHKFDDGRMDKTIGVVMSYVKYGQREMWDKRETLAKDHPVVEDVEIITIM